MKIEINEKKNVKVVIKPWGYEKWIAPGKPNFKYALKEIYLKKGKKSSLQFHKKKKKLIIFYQVKAFFIIHKKK